MGLFSSDAKDEIAGVHAGRTCCSASFLRGLTLFGKSVLRGGSRTLVVASERASVARAVISAAHLAGVEATTARAASGRAGARFTVRIDGANVDRANTGINVDRANTGINVDRATLVARARLKSCGLHPAGALQRLPHRVCCRRTILRAAFLACGSVTDPARGYHLEFFCRNDKAARLLCDLIAGFGVDAGIARRRGRSLVYLKHAEAVSVILGNMGANHAVLKVAERRAVNLTKNSIRRRVNSETANAARAAASAARQRRAAARAIARRGLGKMSRAVREAAQLRIAYPTRTLRELAGAARPPISKAAMASRLRLLERLSKR